MIHTSYTVGITTGQYKALQSVMVDQKEWIRNAIHNQARIASDDIISKLIAHCNSNSIALAVGVDAQITQAYAVGVAHTASDGDSYTMPG
mgnify:CR=1 FL=1